LRTKAGWRQRRIDKLHSGAYPGRMYRFILALGLVLIGGSFSAANAALEVASPFGDHMVLQREKPIRVWGKADPASKVRLALGDNEAEVTADAAGKWHAEFPALPAGGPYELKITSGPENVVFQDVLIGEVWICSGQSNMEWPVRGSLRAEEETAAADHPRLRFFKVGRKTSPEPVEQVSGTWEVCTPQTAAPFSAVGYFFARDLQAKLDVPIGLIGTYWGGTPAEAWTRAGALEGEPEFAPILEKLASSPDLDPDAQAAALAEVEKRRAQIVDPWLVPVAPKAAWLAASEKLGGEWKDIQVPGLWESTASLNIDGVVWYRRVIELTEAQARMADRLELGAVDDFDFTYINGTLVGKTGRETKDFWAKPRSYALASSVLKAGPNVLLVRVIDHGYGGGFSGVDSQVALVLADGSKVPLAGKWEYRVEASATLPLPPSEKAQYMAGYLYNGMLAPLIPYTIRGAIWYQGEANASRGEQYRKLFPTMIRNWRQDWDQGDFPFYFVQLANFRERLAEPTSSDWAELREAQAMTLALPNTGMAVAIDIGEAGNIHPRNKQEVGRRLAQIALSKDYGVTVSEGWGAGWPLIGRFFEKPLPYSGPVYRSMKIENGKIRLFFDQVNGGLVSRSEGALKGFALAGEDQQFVWADAVIEGETVVLSSPQVKNPVAARYGWANNPEVGLYNAVGLPASPFRTDTWPGITAGKF
jgi:sialate O-acetylesterase